MALLAQRMNHMHMHASRAAALLLGLGLLAGCASQPAPTPAPEPVVAPSPAPPPAVNNETKTEVTLDEETNVFFMLASSTLSRDEKDKLRRHAARLKEDGEQIVTLVGHTDNTGSRAYNLAIADQRVNAVARYLKALGVPTRQVRKGFAPREQTPPTCKSSACLQKMRRVELIFAAD